MAIIQHFKLGNTHIYIDDTYLPKSEEEKQKVYEEFNKIGLEILYGKEN